MADEHDYWDLKRRVENHDGRGPFRFFFGDVEDVRAMLAVITAQEATIAGLVAWLDNEKRALVPRVESDEGPYWDGRYDAFADVKRQIALRAAHPPPAPDNAAESVVIEADMDRVEEAVRTALAENDGMTPCEIQRVVTKEVNRQIAEGLVSTPGRVEND